MRDLMNNLAVAQSVAPLLRTATVEGDGVDRRDYDAVGFVFHAGTITDGTFTPSIEVSDDDVSYAAAAAGDVVGTLAALASDGVAKATYVGSARYVRAVITASGSPSTGGTVGAHVILGEAHQRPVA